MTKNKDLKRIIRARMKKTGEAYTTARTQVTRKSPAQKSSSIESKSHAALAGMTDAIVRQKTGSNWDGWVKSLDGLGAGKMSHRDIAAIVHDKFQIDNWWSQTVTVGYERIKGLRTRGQRRDGSFEMTKSRTYDVPIDTLYEAWSDTKRRRRWLDVPGVKIRTATAPKSMRLGWPDGAIIAVGFIARGSGKSSVALAHTKLQDRATADSLKKYWSDRLDSLGDLLTEDAAAKSR